MDNILKKIKNNKRFVLLFICLALFICILINVLNKNITGFDTFVYNAIISLKSDLATIVLKTITEFGSAKILIIIAVICLLSIKNRKIGASIAINLASIGLINHILKEIIQRQRPPIEFRLVEETSFSFPSGHSMASMAFYGFIIYFVFKNIKNKEIRNIICISLSALIALIGVSRIYLGVHYASDVLAGFLLSIAYLVIYVTFILKLIGIKEK